MKSTLQGIARTIGAAKQQKAPVTAERLRDMLKHCDGTLRGLRDRALLLLGFAGAMRRSELVALIRRGPLILGQIDVDSDVPDPFTPAEEAAVRQVADALAVLL